jgi:leader peptidase (prepilin peptidase) / N-methyltransferase
VIELIPEGYWLVFAAVTGAVLGSFASVVIHRLPIMMEREWLQEHQAFLGEETREPSAPRYDLSFPGSSCPHCGGHIPPWFNFPLIGFLVLRGRCHACGHPISVRYPLLEMLGLVMAISALLCFGPGAEALWAMVLGTGLLILSFIDLDHRILPDRLTLFLLWVGLVLSVFDLFTDSHSSILGASLGYGLLWTIHALFRLLARKEGMGRGDFKLLAALGAWMGVSHLPLIVFISSVSGAMVGVALILLGVRKREDAIPFGPFLALAGWIALLAGDRINAQYLSFYAG